MAKDYTDIITSYHRSRPKFAATVSALTQPFSDLTAFIQNLPLDFDLDSAIGAQLDVVGVWVGRSRSIPIPIANAWFTFDDTKRGFDFGVWKGPYDTSTGIIRLDDDTYRTFLRAKIAANNWNGTLATAKSAFDLIFSGTAGTYLFVVDNGDMTMTLGLSGIVPPILFLALLEQNFLPLKPEGVLLDYSITSVSGSPVFGFDIANSYIGGFDTGSWGVAPTYYTA